MIKPLLRFYDPWRERISIDDVDLRDIDLSFYIEATLRQEH